MDINYKIILDNTQYVEGINNALAALRDLNAETEKTKQQTKLVFTGAAAESDKLALSLGLIAKSNAILISEFRSLGDMIRKSMSASSDVKTLETEVAKLKAQLEGLRSSTSGVASGMGNIKNQLVALRIAGKENTEEYRKLNAEYARLQANMLAVENSAKQYRQTNKALIADIKDTGQVSALAGANVISFGQILSDLPYGIRGVANNLQQLSATMVFLVAQAGSMRAAMSALFTAMAGPLGIIVAVQGALAAWDFYSNSVGKANKQTDEAKEAADRYTESLAQEYAQAQIMFGALEKLIKSGKDLNKTKALAKEINDTYNTDLNTEKTTVEALNVAYGNVIDNIKKKIALQSVQDKLIASIEGELKAQDAINKAKERQKEIDEELKRLRPSGITLLQLAARGEQIDKLEKEEEELNKKISAYEDNRERHISNQALLLERAKQIQAEIVEIKNEESGVDEAALDRKKQLAKDLKQILKESQDAWEEYDRRVSAIYLKRLDIQKRLEEEQEDLQDQLDEEFWSTGQEDTGESFPKPEKAKKKQGALAEALGITDAEVNSMLRAIRTIGKELTEVFNEINEAAQRNNEKVIEGLNDVISATEQRIDKESELAQKGLANNLEAEKAYLAEQQAQRDAAYQRQKELELQKLRLDSISQLSSLITASAQIWQTTSKILPPVGTALALGAIAAMFTSFAVSKAKAAELIKSGETFEEGGKIQGKRHSSGGEKYYNSDRSHVVEIEDGEYVTNRESTAKYEALLEAVNNDNLHTHNLRELLEGTGVELPFVDTAKLSARLKNQTIEANSIGGSGSGSQAKSDVSKDIAEIKGYVKGIAEKPSTIVDKDAVVTKTGNRTIITKKWPQRN